MLRAPGCERGAKRRQPEHTKNWSRRCQAGDWRCQRLYQKLILLARAQHTERRCFMAGKEACQDRK